MTHQTTVQTKAQDSGCRQSITLLGATGSVGASTLDVISRNPQKLVIYALTANKNWQKLFKLVQRHQPQWAVCFDEDAALQLNQAVKDSGLSTGVLSGMAGLEQVASDTAVDTVVAAIVGAAGLLPTLAAVQSGKKIMLANKEALVMAGDFFMQQVARHRALLLPVDSEHNALFQCLPNHHYKNGQPIDWSELGVEKLVLTASGGPFLHSSLHQLEQVTPDQACHHPNWKMGRKISVDSATLMNKGLEVIEASYLYAISADSIDVLIHPQSIIHSMVSYKDGSVLAELGNPDMRTPIAHVLCWPERITSGVGPLDLVKHHQLDFSAPDLTRFPCVALAYRALKQGGTAPAIINAANEIAVAAFLEQQIAFLKIATVIEMTLNQLQPTPAHDLPTILQADEHARKVASAVVHSLKINAQTLQGGTEDD